MIHPSPDLSGSNPEPNPSPEIITEVTQLTPEAITEGICKLFDTKAENIFCVFSKDLRNHVVNPATPGRPWCSKIRKHAENIAKEIGGVVIPVDQAIKLMFQQMVQKQQKKERKWKSSQYGILTVQDGCLVGLSSSFWE